MGKKSSARISYASALAAVILSAAGAFAEDTAADWPSFRGVGGRALSSDTNTSIFWDVKSGKGILWKADIPLPGSGSAIVSGGKVIVSGASGTEGGVFCFDIETGKLIWKGAVPLKGKPEIFEEETTTLAPATPVTDGKLVFAVFATGALAAFKMEGTPAWTADLGLPEMSYGYASSPAIHGDILIVQHDQSDEKGAIMAFDKRTGKEIWRVKRQMGASWSSPVVIETERGPQVILVSCGGVSAHDPKDGRQIWFVKKESHDVVAAAAFGRGLVIATLGSGGTFAIRPDGNGDVTKTHVAWSNEDLGSDVASPVFAGNSIFMISSSLVCLNIADGVKISEREIEGQFYSSPIVAGGKLYVANRDGEVTVFKADKALEVLGRASFGGNCDSTPAVSGGRLLFRTLKKLYCVAPAEKAPVAGQ